MNAARTWQQKLAALTKLRPADLVPVAPQAAEKRTGLSMGESQALTTAAWGITRQAQDEFAAASHTKLAAAWASGFFDDLVTPTSATPATRRFVRTPRWRSSPASSPSSAAPTGR